MREAYLALRVAAEHAGYLLDAIFAADDASVSGGDARAFALRDYDVVMGTGRDLRKVGDGEHLVASGYPAHGVPDLEAHAATDAGIDLVEDQRRYVVEASEDRLEREHQA